MSRGPLRYGGLSDEELAECLTLWFVRHGASRDVWSRTATGRRIKRALTTLGRFKNRPRGNPAKGRAAMLAKRAEREGKRSAQHGGPSAAPRGGRGIAPGDGVRTGMRAKGGPRRVTVVTQQSGDEACGAPTES